MFSGAFENLQVAIKDGRTRMRNIRLRFYVFKTYTVQDKSIQIAVLA